MKVYRLVRATQVQTILSPADAERMLATGDWLIAAPRPRSRMAKRMRELNNKRRAEGWTTRTLWFNAEQLAALKAALLPGESYAELVNRLVRKNSLL